VVISRRRSPAGRAVWQMGHPVYLQGGEKEVQCFLRQFHNRSYLRFARDILYLIFAPRDHE